MRPSDIVILGPVKATNGRLNFTPVFTPRCNFAGCSEPAVGYFLQYGEKDVWVCLRHKNAVEKVAAENRIVVTKTISDSNELLRLPCPLGKVPREGDDGFNVVERHRNSAATIIVDPSLLESMKGIEL